MVMKKKMGRPTIPETKKLQVHVRALVSSPVQDELFNLAQLLDIPIMGDAVPSDIIRLGLYTLLEKLSENEKILEDPTFKRVREVHATLP